MSRSKSGPHDRSPAARPSEPPRLPAARPPQRNKWLLIASGLLLLAWLVVQLILASIAGRQKAEVSGALQPAADARDRKQA